MKTYRERFKEIIADAFSRLDHSDYQDAFTVEKENEAIDITTDLVLKMVLRGLVDPDSDAPASMPGINEAFIERRAAEAAEEFEQMMQAEQALHENAAEEAEQ